MAVSSTSPAASKPPRQGSSLSQKYLLAYNAISLFLWSILTLRLLALLPPVLLHPDLNLHHIHSALFPLLQLTQSFALLEILHSLFGLVRAPVLTTALQVASRILVVWGILWLAPEIVEGRRRNRPQDPPWGNRVTDGDGKGWMGDWAEVGILLAWGVTECVRYGFFLAKEGGLGVPGWLKWARYNTFFVLYPLGIGSEVWLICLALKPLRQKLGSPYEMLLKAALLVYVPGSYILYTYMMAQRRKVLRKKGD